MRFPGDIGTCLDEGDRELRLALMQPRGEDYAADATANDDDVSHDVCRDCSRVQDEKSERCGRRRVVIVLVLQVRRQEVLVINSLFTCGVLGTTAYAAA